MTDDSRAVHDATALRAIAHPIRNRILGEMSATGPTRAADLARDLGLPANSVSFHLRQLAKYGLIEEATGEARDRRDRVWRLVHEEGLTIDTGDLSRSPGGEAAVRVFRKSARTWAHHVVDVAYTADKDPDTLRSISSYTVRLTKEEAAEMAAELDAVIQTWSRRTRGRDASRRTYNYLSFLQPYPDESS